MKKVLLALAITMSSVSSFATDYVYKCAQARTTAEEKVATTKLKSTYLLASKGQLSLLFSPDIVIASIDKRLSYGGAPHDWTNYGGYFRSTAGEVFLCQRPM